MPSARDINQFRREVERIISRYRDDRRDDFDVADLFFIMIVNFENDYQNLKNVFTELNVMSQCIRRFTGQKLNMSVASNIMK